jgi:hypothetical protein
VEFEAYCFEVGHASFAASSDDLVGEIAFVGVVLDFELVFEPGDCKHVTELHLLFDAVAGLILTSSDQPNGIEVP